MLLPASPVVTQRSIWHIKVIPPLANGTIASPIAVTRFGAGGGARNEGPGISKVVTNTIAPGRVIPAHHVIAAIWHTTATV